ncbi:DnaJ domain-containing protein [Marmoricola sp. URHB0036]|uniref:J domain-containing protein n=1 Tax=Marmoricola sp. URHB0036 TaxID=1298863 RepID=UPI0003FC69D9|nr:DnaJ domain-containing protein [Marmoricola sp. URHB0036]
MTSSTNPTWYDVLGVSRDASPAEIKAAWRDATDKFEPGSGAGQFRMFNEAADVLLDPARRAEYDASLAAPGGTSEAAPPPPAPVAAEPTPLVDPETDAKAQRREERARRREQKREAKASQAPAAEPASRWTMVVAGLVALLAVAAVVVAVVLGLQVRTEARVADAREQAPAAAERAAKAIFAYNYQDMPADLARAKPYLTDDFAKEFTKNFHLLEKQQDGTPGPAIQTKTVVKSDVPATSVVDAEDGVVRVLAYVNLTSTRPGRDPQIFQNRVTMKMVKDGDRWLVDKVDTY